MREKGRTMTIRNITEDGNRASTAAVSPDARCLYVAPFLRHLDVSDSGAKSFSNIETPHSFSFGPS